MSYTCIYCISICKYTGRCKTNDIGQAGIVAYSVDFRMEFESYDEVNVYSIQCFHNSIHILTTLVL